MTTASSTPSMRRQVLVPGHNCWTAVESNAGGVVVDGRNYYLAFYNAARQARRYLLIAGWRFNSDVRLVRGRDAEALGGEVKLAPFLHQLCRDNSQLEIYILAWDYSTIFLHEWEWFQKQKFEEHGQGRIHFLFDAEHAVAGSHHEKFVVVDGQHSFVGGLDFNADDWDDRFHCAHHSDRVDSGQTEPHRPYHDLQAYLGGPAARELADHFRRRWQRAGGNDIDLPGVPDQPAPALRRIAVPAGPVALSWNRARTTTDPTSVHEVRQLYLDAIDAAEELIFIENQYFSSEAVYQALLRRLQALDRTKLDLVLILPKQLASWVEAMTQGPLQVRMLAGLYEAARQTGHRFGAYYRVSSGTDHGREEPVIIHSKLLIVDDVFMTLGSANTSNRSMGLDTELNVSWEAATSGNERLSRAIRRVRLSLLSEHTGCGMRADARQALRCKRGLVDVLDRLAH
jgi:phospholipase D1/2